MSEHPELPDLIRKTGVPVPQVLDRSGETLAWKPAEDMAPKLDDLIEALGARATEATLAAIQTALTDGTQKVQLSGSNLALRQTIRTGAKTVTSTAAEIFAGASRLSGRHAMVITNTGADIVYIGAVGVTTSNGFPIFPQDTLRIEFDPTSSAGVFARTSGPNVQVRVVELA